MIELDPSPWLVLAIPFLVGVVYISRRGLMRNEFRVLGKNGWARYPTWSLNWVKATLVNFAFLGGSAFVVYQALMHGTEFSREPERPMPPLGGHLHETVHADRNPASLAKCVADLNHGQGFNLGSEDWRVVVRNGRNEVMYTFEIEPDGEGSRMDVRLWKMSPFVGWSKCLAREDR